jgi:hypothetical protein
MLVREIAADKSLAIGNEVFPINPVMIVVCPTKALEEDIVGLVITYDGMSLTLAKATHSREAGLTAIIINSMLLGNLNVTYGKKRLKVLPWSWYLRKSWHRETSTSYLELGSFGIAYLP